jgi:hypothetical protein
MAIVFFVAALLSLAVMCWPYMIPYTITVASAAAPGKIAILPVLGRRGIRIACYRDLYGCRPLAVSRQAAQRIRLTAGVAGARVPALMPISDRIGYSLRSHILGLPDLEGLLPSSQ